MNWPDDFINKVICGDCLDILPLIPEGAVDLVFTSPPYNANKDYGDSSIDTYTVDEWFGFISDILKQSLRVVTPGGRVIVNLPTVITTDKVWTIGRIMESGAELDGARFEELIVWAKGRASHPEANSTAWGSPNKPHFRSCWEPILVFRKDGEKVPLNDLTITDIACPLTLNLWEVPPSLPYKKVHPATFPVRIPSRLSRLFTTSRDIILDPFAGSGTTLVAAKQLGRKYVGIEISPEYCGIAEDRLRQEELF